MRKRRIRRITVNPYIKSKMVLPAIPTISPEKLAFRQAIRQTRELLSKKADYAQTQ